MKRWLLVLIALVLLKGTFVYAVSTTVTVTPDKSFYHPGEIVTLHIQTTTPDAVRVEAQISYLSRTVATLSAPLIDGQADLTWQPPAESPRGYGLDLTIYGADEAVLATTSTAFDILDRWIDAPRYGFLSDFTPQRAGDAETLDWLLKHHINGLQFYDWQYRWEDLLPDDNSFSDGMGRPLSLETVTHLIDLAHTGNIAAMPYSAIYGASMPFYETHKDWALVSAHGDLFTLGGFIAILDPTPGSAWNAHLLAEYADVLDHTAFDGIHIDQYGAPKTAFDTAGNPVDLAEVFPQFIDQTAALVSEKRGSDGVTIFNCVGNWPVETVAPSNEDAVYIEVWSPYTDYLDLNRIIANAEHWGGGKPVIIAAYIDPAQAINWRLANAVIFASGATYIETGEPNALLADPYFPKYGTLNADDQALFQRYYDFIVRYENVLALGTSAAANDRARAVDLAANGVEVRTSGIRAKGRVVPIVRAGADFETYNLLNFVGIDDSAWNGKTTIAPTPFENLAVNIDVTRAVKAVWAASPDSAVTMSAQSLPFSVSARVLSVTLPHLDTWSMIVVEYAE